MTFLQDLLDETAAEGSVAAHDVAPAVGRIGSDTAEDDVKKKKKKKKFSILKRMTLGEKEEKFNISDVISKMKSAEKSAETDDDTVAFGLEDEEGNMVKVFVRTDQAVEFETALEAGLAGNDDDDDEESTTFEIAEVLFNLKDKFDIIDVEWGAIPEDEEENQEVEGDESKGLGDENKDSGDEELGDEEMIANDDSGEEAATSVLQQVIDMMKTDAEAKKAEAEAKKAEAETQSAKYVAQAASEKVKQEEEILDMETFNKKKSDEGKEAKRLAQLAKYKHDLAGEEGSTEVEAAPEEEEQEVEFTTDKLIDYLRKRLQAN